MSITLPFSLLHSARNVVSANTLFIEGHPDFSAFDSRVAQDIHADDAAVDAVLTISGAKTPHGSITFGFHEDLNQATMMALEGMLDLMKELFGYKRKEALALSNLVVDLHITQIVNGVRGVHAILPHGAILQG